jgi:hypothetical protein
VGQFFSPTHRTLSLLSNLSFCINFASNPYIYFMSFVVMNYLRCKCRQQSVLTLKICLSVCDERRGCESHINNPTGVA